MTCAQCNSSIGRSDRFCGSCGAAVPGKGGASGRGAASADGIVEAIKGSWAFESTRKPLLGLGVFILGLVISGALAETESLWFTLVVGLGLFACLVIEARSKPRGNAPMYVFSGISLILVIIWTLFFASTVLLGLIANLFDEGTLGSPDLELAIGPGLGLGGAIFMFLTGMRRLLLRSSNLLKSTE